MNIVRLDAYPINNQCGICLEIFRLPSSAYVHQDGTAHPYHIYCISDWVLQPRRQNCPSCRINITYINGLTLEQHATVFYDQIARIRHAARHSNLDILKTVLTEREFPPDEIGAAFVTGTQERHRDIVFYLANQEIPIPYEYMEKAFEEAAKIGPNLLKRWIDCIPFEKRCEVVREAIKRGNTDTARNWLLNAPLTTRGYKEAFRSATLKHPNCTIAGLLLHDDLVEEGYLSNSARHAAKTGNLAMVQLFFNSGKVTDRIRQEAVISASSGGHLEIVQLLNGENLTGRQQHDAMLGAATIGNDAIIQYLMLSRTPPQGDLGTYIEIAATNGHPSAVRLLLTKIPIEGAQPNQLYGALIQASINGHLEIVNDLLERGIPENYRIRAFGCAIEKNHIQIGHRLLELGPITEQDRGRVIISSLHALLPVAARGLLKDRLSGNVELSMQDRETALEYTRHDDDEETTHLLLQNGIISAGFRGKMVLLCIEEEQVPLLQAFLQKGHYKNEALGLEVIQMAKNGQEPAVINLLQNNLLSEEDNVKVLQAIPGHPQLQPILRDSSITELARSQAVIEASAGGPGRIVQILVEDGPISIASRDFAIIAGIRNNQPALSFSLLRGLEHDHWHRALLEAVSLGKLEIVTNLLQNIDISPDERGNAVYRATVNNHLHIVEALNCQLISTTDRAKALKKAVTDANLPIAKILIASGPISDEDRGVALQIAVRKGNLGFVEIILQSGNLQESSVREAIRTAENMNHDMIARTLKNTLPCTFM